MPIRILWGEDDLAIALRVKKLIEQVVDPSYKTFNYSQYDASRAIGEIFAEISTFPAIKGGRLIYLKDSTICNTCPLDVLQQLEYVLPKIPTANTLVISSKTKPDSRTKLGKLLFKYSTVEEFSLISAWDNEALINYVEKLANKLGIKISQAAIALLIESVGNNSSKLYNELEKLKTFTSGKQIEAETVSLLVANTNGSALKLASAILAEDTSSALKLTDDLLNSNEPALKIVATLVTTFRTWLAVKVCMIAGWQNDSAIASLADVKNPKRLYFLRQEVAKVPVERLRQILPLLLELELALKEGADEKRSLQQQIIQLCCNNLCTS